MLPFITDIATSGSRVLCMAIPSNFVPRKLHLMESMTRFRFACIAAALFCPIAAWPQSAEWITIGRDLFAFHEDVFHNQKIRIESTVVSDVEIFIELIGIPNSAKINALRLQIRRSPGLKNAFAYYGQGYRSIAYDPDWAASATVEFYLVLGHEAGHLFCEHEGKPQSAKIELEADRFGGASVKRFEIYHNRLFFSAVMAAAAARYTQSGSVLYPSPVARLQALKSGYEQGSPCGGLLPVEQGGFSRGSR